jgi:tetratricopeptide (TPR) repeat protein
MRDLKRKFTAIALLAASLSALHGQFPSQEFEEQWRLKWEDPAFVEAFIGTYEPLTDAEPQFENKKEINLVREMSELFKENPRAAAARLQQDLNEDSSATYLYLLGTLYLTAQENDQAKLYYEKALEKFPNYRRAHKNLSLIYLQDQDYDKALEHIHRSIALGERDGRLYGYLGFIYLSEQDYVAAESAYREAILQQPDENNWKVGLAQCLIGLEKYQDADALFQKLIEQDPSKSDYWLLQVNAYLGMGKPVRAIANLEMLRRMGKLTPASLKLLGDIYMNEKMTQQALEVYSELIERDEKAQYLDAAIRLGRILIELQSYDQALAILDKIESSYSAVDADDKRSILNLKAQVARATGDDELARTTLVAVLEQDPLNGDALLELADIYQSQDKIEEAIDMYERAERVKGFESQALIKHAQLLVREKEFSKAVPLLKESLTLVDDPRVARFLESVEQAARNQ